jgi:PAS domain S-box-containing protein
MSNPPVSDKQALRLLAERTMASRTGAYTAEAYAALTPEAQQQLLHELQVHQIELELQNDELRRTQTALDTAQARYFDFYDLAPVGYITVNEKALILQANLTTATLLGISRLQLIGQPLPRFMPAPDADRYYLLCQEALASASVQSCELQMRQASGNLVWVSLQALAVPGDAGSAVIRMVLSDITARKQLEERMVQRDADTKAMLDGASDAIFIADAAGRYQYVNQQATQLLGFSHDELLGMGIPDITPDDDLAAIQVLFRQLLETGVLRFETLLKRSNGSTVAVELNCRMLADGRVYGACRDITERKQVEVLRAANNKFRDAILDSVPSQIAVLDKTGTIVAVNQRWRDFALDNSPTPGQPASHTDVGTNYLAICQTTTDHPTNGSDTDGSAALARDGILGVMNGSAPSFQIEYPCHSPTQERWFSLAVTPLNLDNQAVVVTHTDITHRKQLEQALKQAAEDQFRLLADNTSDGILIVGADRQVQYVSPVYLKQLGFSEAEELGSTPERVFSLIHPQERDAIVQGIERAIESKASDQLYTYRARHRLGHYIWRENNARFQYDEFGNFAGVCIVARDITERKRTEAEMGEMNRNLTQSRQKLRDLVAFNATAIEAERKHIARDVHDELGQVLTALRMDMSLLNMQFGALDPALPGKVDGMKALVDRAMQGVRDVATRLRPMALDMGLATAMEAQCAEFSARTSIACTFRAQQDLMDMDETRAVAVYRIVQESLTNISRYAQASQVQVSLGYSGNDLGVEVRDNGQGFLAADVQRAKTYGLLGMRERAMALGGHLDIISVPGQGTVVGLTIPIHPDTIGEPP